MFSYRDFAIYYERTMNDSEHTLACLTTDKWWQICKTTRNCFIL